MAIEPGNDSFDRSSLRHAIATLVYRAAKAVAVTNPEFADFRCAESSRSPVEILAHMVDLMDWALSTARGKEEWHAAQPLSFADECARFFTATKALDDYLASEQPLGDVAARLFQGPIADALTHVGQLTYLRRLFGEPVKFENYFRADIVKGRTGAQQATERVEFD